MTIKKILKRIFQKVIPSSYADSKNISYNEDLKVLVAKGLIEQIITNKTYQSIQDAEFKVFSQFGDDGIIQYLINNVNVSKEYFVEFGVEDYIESNTRFLLINNNWSGLVIDSDSMCINDIKNNQIYWKYDLKVLHGFINADNINQILIENGLSGEIGLLSIDIDGNDYWIWKSINAINPAIVIVEYNSVFGVNYSITIPYRPDFIRAKAHFSNLYWGCSLKSLCLLADKKGYSFIGSNSNGNNAYFLRNDLLGKIKPIKIEDGYVKSKFKESRDHKGNLTYLSEGNRIEIIKDMVVCDTERDLTLKIRELADYNLRVGV